LRNWLKDDLTFSYQPGSIPSDVTTGYDSIQRILLFKHPYSCQFNINEIAVGNKEEQLSFDDSADLFPFQSKVTFLVSSSTIMKRLVKGIASYFESFSNVYGTKEEQ
jgi:hypothetical protein